MTILWSSLYCPSDDAGAMTVALRESLSALGYELYNPFGLIPGKAYRQSVRLFVAPAANGWSRVIGELDEGLLLHCSQSALCLYVTLNVGGGQIRAYSAGASADAAGVLLPYVRDGRTGDDLRRILAGEYGTAPLPDTAPTQGSSDLPLAALSDDIQALAGGVNPAQAQKLFSRLSGSVLKKAGGDKGKADDARALISGQPQADWNSPAGQQIRALMACLTMPENWREPDFIALRDAYPLHERRRRSPNARLYPGDDAAMARVPDALDYTPIYGGMM